MIRQLIRTLAAVSFRPALVNMKVRTLVPWVFLVAVAGPVSGQQIKNTTGCVTAAVTNGPEVSSTGGYMEWDYTFTNRCTRTVSLRWFVRSARSNGETWSTPSGRDLEPGEIYEAAGGGLWAIKTGGAQVPRPLVVYCAFRPDAPADPEKRRCYPEDTLTGTEAAQEAGAYVMETVKDWRSIG